MDSGVDPELLATFLDESEESLAQVAPLLISLETTHGDLSAIDAIFRPIHSLKGNASFFELMTVKRVAHEMETLLDGFRKGRLPVERQRIDALLAGMDLLGRLLVRVRGGESDEDVVASEPVLAQLRTGSAPPAGSDLPAIAGIIRSILAASDAGVRDGYEQILRLAGIVPSAAAAAPSAPSAPPALAPVASEAPFAEHHDEGGAARRSADPGSAGKTMRISESAIDTFLHYVGELVVVGDMFRHLQAKAAGPGMKVIGRDLRRANETFATLSNQLQSSIMEIRRVPLTPLLHKLPRLVRDTAQAIGKEVELVSSGGDVLIDKSLLDLLDAPMTHMVRNAIDHGVEKPELREQRGKPRTGRITVSFTESASNVLLTVADDGNGLNLPAIRAKAEQCGMIAPGALMTEADIVNLIFLSGVSTAQSVTEISGRGVGMDVVKRAIEDAGGSIGISTVSGAGSEFRIKLPKGVTTQIVGGYMVRCAGTSYVIPLERVRETFRTRREELQRLCGRGACVIRRDQTVPLVELSRVLVDRDADWHEKGLPVVVVEASRRSLALVVDAVLGVHKVVIRRLPGVPSGASLVSGAALLGDGRLALVLDLDRLRTPELHQREEAA